MGTELLDILLTVLPLMPLIVLYLLPKQNKKSFFKITHYAKAMKNFHSNCYEKTMRIIWMIAHINLFTRTSPTDHSSKCLTLVLS